MGGKMVSVDLAELRNFKAQLIEYGARVGIELENALNEEGQVIASVAKELVPVDLGNLRASITVDPPIRAFHENGELFVTITAGDTAVQYAEIQEENESFQHTVGQAHYMKEATERVTVGIEARFAERIGKI
jgi:hypothetical protein